MLNGKQKRYLRALGNTRKALFQIGKDGISLNLIDTLNDSLRVHELVKISVLKTCDIDIKELSFDIAMSTKSEVVQIIGKTFLIYKASKEKRIELP
ncbi:MAG: YhbY family RNA-binding protein [Anaerorhabdus sp.]